MISRIKWEEARSVKCCDGCNKQIDKGETYILAKVSIEEEDSKISRLIAITLCENCIVDFEDVATVVKSQDESF